MVETNTEYSETKKKTGDEAYATLIEDASDIHESYKSNKMFYFHAIVAAVVIAINFFIWVIVDFANEGINVWWIYVIAFFILTLGLHHYVIIHHARRLWFNFHALFYLVVNGLLFLTALQSDATHWFIYPLFGLAIPLAMHYAYEQHEKNPSREGSTIYDVHFAFFISTNILIFQIYLANGHSSPWFLYVFAGLGFPLMLHYNHVKNQLSLFMGHLTLFITVNSILFVVWITNHQSPWFVFIFGIWGIILIGHYVKFEKSSVKVSHQQSSPVLADEENVAQESLENDETLYPNLEKDVDSSNEEHEEVPLN